MTGARRWVQVITIAVISALGVQAVASSSVHAAPSVSPGSPASDIQPIPTRPKACTAKQLAAVKIDRCVVFAEGSPSDHGFARPPFVTDELSTTPVDASSWKRLSVGATGPRVIVLQERLKQRYPEVLVLGRFGSQTKSAVQRFQRDNGLPVTGSVDASTASALGVLVSAKLPSFPPQGWRWNGWEFSGSAALAAWESRLTAGDVRSDPQAAPLFEGFLADLRRGNLRIDEASTYSFRCAATTVRNCRGQGSAHLSYHAWGMAVDLNYSTNSLQTVDDDIDACGAQVQHAVPNWVLAAAQHWGLFWGGWYSCPASGALSAVRDPHHFEFRGSPELAAAIIAKNTGTTTGRKASKATVPGIGQLLLNCGDQGDAVIRLRKLLPRSYRPRESTFLTDVFTPRLSVAVARWQRDRGLAITGALDPDTAAGLKVKVRHSEVFPVLHLHSCGTSVNALQGALGIKVTGRFDRTTMAALRSWQTAHGLAPTGVTDTATAGALGLRTADLAGSANLVEPPSDDVTPVRRLGVASLMPTAAVAATGSAAPRARLNHPGRRVE